VLGRAYVGVRVLFMPVFTSLMACHNLVPLWLLVAPGGDPWIRGLRGATASTGVTSWEMFGVLWNVSTLNFTFVIPWEPSSILHLVGWLHGARASLQSVP